MFLGHHTPRLDEKGRLFLPARYRDVLAGGVVVTQGQEPCLHLYAAEDFRARAEAVLEAPQTTPEARDAVRAFFSTAFDQVPDKQGRITLSPELRDFAGLDRDVVVVGVGRRLEIWDAPTWHGRSGARNAALASEVLQGVL